MSATRCFYIEVHLIDTLRNLRVTYGDLCIARFEWILYQQTSWRQEYTYDLSNVVNSGEEVNNEIVSGELYDYFKAHEDMYQLKDCQIPKEFVPDAFFIVKFYDECEADEYTETEDSPVKAQRKTKKLKINIATTSSDEDTE